MERINMKWNPDTEPLASAKIGAKAQQQQKVLEEKKRQLAAHQASLEAKQQAIPQSAPAKASAVYTEAPAELNFDILQQNLQNCLEIVGDEVMKGYIPSLQHCPVIPLDDSTLKALPPVQFFRISEMVYQEDEFSVHKLATVFHALSNKPCTLVLMIRSDGQHNDFYLGVRSRDSRYSTGTMRKMLEQSLLGLFPGSSTANYLNKEFETDMKRMKISCISSVTCIADYKQEKSFMGNHEFIQGLEKFIYSMQGQAFTAICIANNLAHHDLVETRKEYERIYTLLSPFAQMQCNYAVNSTSSVSDSDTSGHAVTDSSGFSKGINVTQHTSAAQTKGSSSSLSQTDTTGKNSSTSTGQSHTTGTSDGVNQSENITNAESTFSSGGMGASVNVGINVGINKQSGVSSSVSRGKTYGTSHTASVSDSISQNLTQGINTSKAIGNTQGKSESETITESTGTGMQYSENQGTSLSKNISHTTALTTALGNSQAVTLNIQNKSLIDMLQRLEKQLARLDECESIGMWDFAAYFLGESTAEVETAASMYQSLVTRSESGLEASAVNTWSKENQMEQVQKYVINFLHPVFLYQFTNRAVNRQIAVDPTVLASTNELAIQLSLPRKSVKGLPVITHAVFAQEILNGYQNKENVLKLGNIMHLGNETETIATLDRESLAMHTFITGSTGSGKSNTVYQMLDKLSRQDVRFLVIEPAKGEYKNVFGGRKDVSVYGTNAKKTPLLQLNPFSFPDDIHVLEHIDRLVEIFNACWPMYAAMPAVLKDVIEQAYRHKGWDLTASYSVTGEFPTFYDLKNELPIIMEQSAYSADTKGDYIGALVTRVNSLTNGINGQIFCSSVELPAEKLFDQNVIIDISRVGSMETKSLLMGILVMKLQEYRMASGTMNAPLRHITVLEEAHNLLRRTSDAQSQESANLQGKSVEMIANAIAEMRTYGEGFIIADQAPGLMDPSVIRNTNTKIIMRLPDESDRELVGKAASLNAEQIAELAKLPLSVAAVYQNNWLEPVLCKIAYFKDTCSYAFHPVSAPEYLAHFFHDLFHLTDDQLLSEKEHEQVEHWIDHLNNTAETKSLLREALQGKCLSANDQGIIAYNLFEGKQLMATLEKETDEKKAVEQVEMQIACMNGLHDMALVRHIKEVLLCTIFREFETLDLRNRFIPYMQKGGTY